MADTGFTPFYPSVEDVDHEAEAEMCQGREYLAPENGLYDPHFGSPAEALAWSPGGED